MIQIPVQNCCGCTACLNNCPQSAIEMKANQEGFLYPSINEKKCVQCRLCEQACPISNPPQISEVIYKCVVARSRDSQVLKESASGGIVDAFCDYMINGCHGYVCGVSFDEEFVPVHEIVDSYDKAKKFRNSKYAQSRQSYTYAKIKRLLQKGDYLLYIGTPCQVAGLKTFLRVDYERLITVDLVCRSIPSPKLWKEYIDWQEKRHRSNAIRVSCRGKTYGYHSGALEIDFANGRHYAGSNRVDRFMKCFHGDVCSRYSCYDCRFKNIHRCSDFTVFDSWKPTDIAISMHNDDDCGYSNVIIHSKKGLEIFNGLRNIVSYDADLERMLLYTGGMESKSINKKPERDNFYKQLEEDGFEKTVEKYAPVSFIDRLIENGKPIVFFLKRRVAKFSQRG